MPVHCPYIARTLPVHCPYIARWVFSTKTRFRALKKGILPFSFFIFAQAHFYRKNPSGNVRAMYGQRTGNVRAMYGHRVGTQNDSNRYKKASKIGIFLLTRPHLFPLLLLTRVALIRVFSSSLLPLIMVLFQLNQTPAPLASPSSFVVFQPIFEADARTQPFLVFAQII